jgi:hypothetical protein
LEAPGELHREMKQRREDEARREQDGSPHQATPGAGIAPCPKIDLS